MQYGDTTIWHCKLSPLNYLKHEQEDTTQSDERGKMLE